LSPKVKFILRGAWLTGVLTDWLRTVQKLKELEKSPIALINTHLGGLEIPTQQNKLKR
jgi:hypothetical protein